MMRWLTDWMGVTGDCHVEMYAMGGFMDSCEHSLLGWVVAGGMGLFLVGVLFVSWLMDGVPDADDRD